MSAIARPLPRTLPTMAEKRKGKPTVGAEKNQILRQTVRAIMEADFGGNLTATAKGLGLSSSAVSDFLLGTRGAGPKTTDALEVYLRRTYDQILAAGGNLDTLRKSPVQPVVAPRAVRFGDLPNWSALAEAAQQEKPTLAAWVWEKLARADVWVEGPVTPSMVADLAVLVSRHFAPPAAS